MSFDVIMAHGFRTRRNTVTYCISLFGLFSSKAFEFNAENT